jgi:hypothetical protein
VNTSCRTLLSRFIYVDSQLARDESFGEAKAGVQRALVICERLATMAGSVGTLALVTLFLDREGIVPSTDDR